MIQIDDPLCSVTRSDCYPVPYDGQQRLVGDSAARLSSLQMKSVLCRLNARVRGQRTHPRPRRRAIRHGTPPSAGDAVQRRDGGSRACALPTCAST